MYSTTFVNSNIESSTIYAVAKTSFKSCKFAGSEIINATDNTIPLIKLEEDSVINGIPSLSRMYSNAVTASSANNLISAPVSNGSAPSWKATPNNYEYILQFGGYCMLSNPAGDEVSVMLMPNPGHPANWRGMGVSMNGHPVKVSISDVAFTYGYLDDTENTGNNVFTLQMIIPGAV